MGDWERMEQFHTNIYFKYFLKIIINIICITFYVFGMRVRLRTIISLNYYYTIKYYKIK